MNLLDENIPESQAQLLRSWGIGTRQIGRDVGRSGMQDDEIIRLLHSLGGVTFFTRDRDFADPRLTHRAYSLIRLDVDQYGAAELIRRVLRHPELSTRAKRMGAVARASHAGLRVWRRDSFEQELPWPAR